ncbi:hypothetical protein GUITHDRAFT_102290 [Guillardia theta CCMP2712]|uniref:Uncharacterized protein n=3 Tax=Guillardia theta TaxID=55529 RepID=L1JVI1_GUITC|nr:hypothetical protein GUITHDRAFT_102290 [Guillardia theta CCMP2712]EKX52387.1 hypothetical protein GUITHDRAFT_102290 [Guillardia theta CCMP2712]|eukprot:XP_005839367.1 hypothetical protein GUITHDRAFT_102290 [Guillardia theta CCMP2712]
MPGQIRFFSKEEGETFLEYPLPLTEQCQSVGDEYRTHLGFNLYLSSSSKSKSRSLEDQVETAPSSSLTPSKNRKQTTAGAELQLLSSLIHVPKTSEEEEFKLNIFDDNRNVDAGPGKEVETVVFRSTAARNVALSDVAKEFEGSHAKDKEENEEDDLLSLMDSAN